MLLSDCLYLRTDFDFSSEGGKIDCVSSFKYPSVILNQKWNWKLYIRSLSRKLGHRLSVYNCNLLFLVYFNRFVLLHSDYADVILGDQKCNNYYRLSKIGLPRRSPFANCRPPRPWYRWNGFHFMWGALDITLKYVGHF